VALGVEVVLPPAGLGGRRHVPIIGAGGSAGLGPLIVDADGKRMDWVLTGSPPGSLEWDRVAVDEDLSTPDAPWLVALDRAGEARGPERARPAQPLRPLQLAGRLGEVQLGALLYAGQGPVRRNQLQDLHVRVAPSMVVARGD
jgi:hypothetical protein